MPEFRKTPSRSETGLAKAATAIALALTLAGCASKGSMKPISHDEPTFMRLTEERVFAQALRQRYLELATNAYDRSDFARSDFYSLRAIMAVEGKLVDPVETGGAVDPTLLAARTRMMSSFSSGVRVGAPDLAARTQAAYDCWALESQSGGDAAIASACSANMETTLAELEVIGTGTRVAAANAPQQYVINSQTPPQTIDAGGSTISIGRQPLNAAPTPAPQYQDTGSYAPQANYASQPIAQAGYAAPQMQQRAALARTMYGAEPMESVSARTFVVEPPAPVSNNGYEYPQQDTVIPTVPLQGGYAPIDLIPDYADLPYSEPVVETVPFAAESQGVPLYDGFSNGYADPGYGGQYVALETEQQAVASMAPIYDGSTSGPRVATLAAPVYNDVGSAPMMAAPEMMAQHGGVLNSLVDARTGGSSDYAVYFGFDSDSITPEGEDVLADTVERLILEDRGTVALMGFTDSAGDSRYNQLLAMRRANAVRSYIQQRADRPVRFRIMPVGEAEAVKNGGDGVTKALNRRVEIMLQ